jgi:hypothetical protein
MQHVDMLGGVEHLEVDHFDPARKNDYIQQYDNLFPAKRACNNKKRASWPTPEEQNAGIRFLNCCKERDYDVHIFEDPDTHEVWGCTPEGRYHVRNLGLNSRNLVEARAERAKLSNLLAKSIFIFRSLDPAIAVYVRALAAILQKHIPLIEYRSKPAKNRGGNGRN